MITGETPSLERFIIDPVGYSPLTEFNQSPEFTLSLNTKDGLNVTTFLAATINASPV
jgi:hypothetical protein